ncbi:PEP-CTERM sorting domain-containing protein [Nitrospira sp. Nam74]
MWWSLVMLLVGLVPVHVHALSLQDLIEQDSFRAGPTTFWNFTASIDIGTYSLGGGPAPLIPGCCTFSTLDDIHVDLRPDGFQVSNIYGTGYSNEGLHGMPSDFTLHFNFDSTHPMFISDWSVSSAQSMGAVAGSIFISESHYRSGAHMNAQIPGSCQHPLMNPCAFHFQGGRAFIGTVVPVPEPTTAALMVAGLSGLAMFRYVGRRYRNRLWGAVCLVMVGFVPAHAHGLSLQDLVDDGSGFSAGAATFSNFAASILVTSYSNDGSPTPLLPGVSVATLDDIQVEAKVEGFEVSNLFGFGQSLHGFAGLPYDFTLWLGFESNRPVVAGEKDVSGGSIDVLARSTFISESQYQSSVGINVRPFGRCQHHPPDITTWPCVVGWSEGSAFIGTVAPESTVVPEPTPAALMVAGVPGLAMLRYLGRKQRN